MAGIDSRVVVVDSVSPLSKEDMESEVGRV